VTTEATEPTADGSQTSGSASNVIKVVVLAALVSVMGFAYLKYADDLSLAGLAEKEAALQSWQQDNPVLAYGAAWLVYVVVTGLSLPGAVPLTLVFGWFFGFWKALLIVSFGSTAGATVAFLLSRYLLQETVQSKFSERLESVNEAFRREGAYYLFSLRLIPAVPFFVINVVMGLTPISVTTFWWVSQCGMLPGTCVFVYAGTQVPDLQTLADQGWQSILSWPLVAAFVLLGLFPIVVKTLMAKFGRTPEAVQNKEEPGRDA